jgi:two-component system cell cycle sensor histidine kinase/response regulator CckA
MNRQDQTELSQALFEEAGDALILFDPDSEQVIDANPMAQRLSGFTRAELLRLQASYLFRAEAQGGLNRLRNAYRKTGVFHSQEGFVLRTKRDGSWIPVNLTITRLHLAPRTLGLMTVRDVREQREAHNQLKKVESELRRVLAAISDCLWSAEIDARGQWTYSYFSPVVEKITGQPADYFLGGHHRWWSAIHPEDRPRWEKALLRLRGGHSSQEEYRIVWPDGTMRWIRDSVMASRAADSYILKLDGVVTDISDAKRAEALVSTQNQALEMIATGSSVPQVLDYLLQSIEAQSPHMLCALLLLEQGRLRLASAPSLPDAYRRALDGSPVGPDAGVCGVAAHTRQPVVVADISVDPQWTHYRDLALRNGLRACWVTPVLARNGTVLGVMAVYYRQAGQPPARDQHLIGVVDHLAALAIERRRAEEALRASEERLSRIFETNADAILIIERAGRITMANAAAERLFGLPRHEIVRRNFNDPAWKISLVDGRCVSAQDFAFSQVLTTGQPVYGVERVLERPDRSQVIVSLNAAPLRDSAGNVVGVVESLSDITERKHAEEALRRSEERFRALVEKSSDLLILLTADGAMSYVTPAVTQLLGYTAEEFLRLPPFANLHPDDRPAMEAMFAACIAEPGHEVRSEFRTLHKDGTYRVLEGHGINRLDDPSVRAVVTNSHDITDRKLAEAQLRDTNETLRALIEASPLAILALDPAGNVRSWNAAATRIFGWTESEVLGQPSPLVPPDKQQESAALRERVLSGEAFAGVEAHRIRKDGAWIDVSISAGPLYDAAGQVDGIIAVLADVTDRKRAEEALARERAILRGLIDSIPDLICYKDNDGVYLGCNTAFEHYCGRAEKDLVGLTDLDLFPTEIGKNHRERDRQMLAGTKARRHEEWLQYPGGKVVLVETLKTPFFGAAGKTLGLIGISRDITERRRLEDQLRQSQKMEAIGQLAGGVAHDFNNLLTAVLGNISLLTASLPAGDPNRELLRDTETAAVRASDLTKQLLGFSRRTALRLEATNLNASVLEAVRILRRTFDPRITVEVKSLAELWTAWADPSQLIQVLINLCINARDAMPTGGRLTLETENVILDSDLAQLHVEARPGEFVRLRVSDTGHGIPDDIRQRIFEPFFTTKHPGQGTGLGLAMVFGIVKQHQGWIDCYSEVNRGTRFDLYLPRFQEGNTVVAPQPAPAAVNGGGGGETILLVDDEAMIRNLGKTILQRYGYEVLLAEDGPQALEIYQQERHRIDLVILDLTMPRLSGHDTLRQMRQTDPAVPVLFASGYSADHLADSERQGVLGFINKPYRPQELASTVRAALNKRQSAPTR